MDVFALVGCAVTACILVVTIRQYRPDMAIILAIAAGIILLMSVLSDLSPSIVQLRGIAERSGIGNDSIGAVAKALGICIVTQTASDICRDAGQQSLASKVDAGGRVAMLAAALPCLVQVLELAAEILG